MKNTIVKTWDQSKPEDEPKVVVIDFTDNDSRAWLIRHLVWAVNKEKTVFVTATEDEVNFRPKEADKPVRERRPSKQKRYFTREPMVRSP